MTTANELLAEIRQWRKENSIIVGSPLDKADRLAEHLVKQLEVARETMGRTTIALYWLENLIWPTEDHIEKFVAEGMKSINKTLEATSLDKEMEG